MRFDFTSHFMRQALAKGFTAEEIHAALYSPEKVTEVRAHPGQRRFIAGRVAVVCAPCNGGWTAVTLYLNGTLTAPRADQLTTPEGRRYAERFAAGLGRG